MDSGMFYGIQQGAIAALQSNPIWFKNLNDVYEKRRTIAWKIADALQCSYDTDSAGLFVWAKLPQGKSAEQTANDLLHNYDVFLAPGTVFGNNGEGYIRISLCVTEETLQTVLARILKDKSI